MWNQLLQLTFGTQGLFDILYLSASGDNLAHFLAVFSEQRFSSVFGDKHNVVYAIIL